MISLPHLETNVTTACQNRCVGCNHFIALQKPMVADPAIIAMDLAALSKVAHVDRYALLGGEPLLHPDIVEIMRIAHASGMCDRVEVITNGIALHKMGEDFWKELDYLTLSLYPNTPEESVELAQQKATEHNFALEIKNITCQPFTYPLTSGGDVAERYKSCWYRTYCFTVDDGYFYRCCMAPFIPEVILGLPKETDGIALEGLTEKALQEYINSPVIPESCYVCAGHGSPMLAWSQESNPAEWIRKSTC